MAFTFKHGDRPLDDYTIQRAVGAGGFGEVYYAISDGGREVALKYLRDNPQVELRGVSHCINLKSPHLISIFDVKKNADGDYFIIMEHCSGPSLRDLLIAEPAGLGVQKAAFFTREIAKGLAYLHDRGIVHRDLKPGNIFFDDGYVKIGDYGLSKFISMSRHSAQTASVGTVHYMAPEIGSGNYSRGVDIYALGVILYEMLLGKVPFEGSTMGEVLMKHLTAQPAVDELHSPFGEIIRKALQKDPKDRYQDVSELISDLLAVEAVKESIAGFSLKSLEGAVQRGSPDPGASPIPSPNPIPSPPGFGRPVSAPQGQKPQPPYPLPKRLERKMDRIASKIERKLGRLDARRDRLGGGRPGPAPPDETPAAAVPHDSPNAARRHNEKRTALSLNRRKRFALSALMALGLSIGLGVVAGNAADSEEVGVSAWMMSLGMSGGLLLGRKAWQWFDIEYGPAWAQKFVALLCAAPFISIGAAPGLTSHSQGDEFLPIFLAMLVLAALASWRNEFKEGAHGELNVWTALWAGIIGTILSAVLSAPCGTEPELALLGGAIAAVVSLILQSACWWFSLKPVPAADGVAPQPPPPTERTVADEKQDADTHPGNHAWHFAPPPLPFAQPIAAAQAAPREASPGTEVYTRLELHDEQAGATPSERIPLRWAVTRAFWALIAFAAAGGAILLGLWPWIEPVGYDETTYALIACAACASVAWFAVRKVTPVKQIGFYLETVRPFFASAALVGIGASLIGLQRYWTCEHFTAEYRALALAVLAFSLFVLHRCTGRPRRSRSSDRAPEPFLRVPPEPGGSTAPIEPGFASPGSDNAPKQQES